MSIQHASIAILLSAFTGLEICRLVLVFERHLHALDAVPQEDLEGSGSSDLCSYTQNPSPLDAAINMQHRSMVINKSKGAETVLSDAIATPSISVLLFVRGY